MSAVGQTRKTSIRVYVFRSTPENGHASRIVWSGSWDPDDPTTISGGPHHDNWPLCQQSCTYRARLMQITLHRLYRRLVLGHPDRPTDHVYLTPLEAIIVRVTPKFR